VVALVAQAALALLLIRRHELDLLSIGSLIFFGPMSAVALRRLPDRRALP
jgi:hypothetical protein